MGEHLQKRLVQTKAIDNPAMEAMLNIMIAAGHLYECNDRICVQHGITRSQYNVLRILRGAYPEGHPRQEITRRMVDRSPDVTRLIDRLEQTGHVERERTDADRRLSIARITPKGLALLESMEPSFDMMYAAINERMGAEDLHAISDLCERLYSAD